MRKILVLLALAVVVIAATSGCAGRCRNFLRRGSPCGGTRMIAPATMAAPMAVAAPAQPPLVQQFVPQVQPQIVMPQAEYCCPQTVPCNPCPPDPCGCVPCESGCGDWNGGYIEGAVIGGDCQNCGSANSFDQGYVEPGTIIPGEIVPQDSGASPDPGPTTEN